MGQKRDPCAGSFLGQGRIQGLLHGGKMVEAQLCRLLRDRDVVNLSESCNPRPERVHHVAEKGLNDLAVPVEDRGDSDRRRQCADDRSPVSSRHPLPGGSRGKPSLFSHGHTLPEGRRVWRRGSPGNFRVPTAWHNHGFSSNRHKFPYVRNSEIRPC